MSYQQTDELNLKIPTLSSATGDEVVEYFSYNFSILEGHDHTLGKGKKLRTSSLNITRNFTANDFDFINSTGVTFYSRESGLKLNSLYVKEKEFYLNAQGTEIQLTFQGFFNSALLGGISGDYASSPAFIYYSLADRGFFFYSDVNMFGNVSAGGLILFNTTTSNPTKYIAIRSEDITSQYEVFTPNSMPTVNSFVTIDNNNSLGYYDLSEGVVSTQGGVTLATSNIKDIGNSFYAIRYNQGGVLSVSNTDAYLPSIGSSIERPSPTNWMFRYNSDSKGLEVVIEGSWKTLTAVNPEDLTLEAVIETSIAPPITTGKVLKYVGGVWVPSDLENLSWGEVDDKPNDITTLSNHSVNELSDIDTSVQEELQLLKYVGGVWKPMPDEGDSAAWGSVFGNVEDQVDLFGMIGLLAERDDIIHEGTVTNFKLIRTSSSQIEGTLPLSNLTNFSASPFLTDQTIGFTGGSTPSWGPVASATGTPSPLTAKGDIWVGSQEDEGVVEHAALPVGESMQALFVNSTLPAGMEWKDSPSIDIKKGRLKGRVVSDLEEPSEGYFELYSNLLSPAILQTKVESIGVGEGSVMIEDSRAIQQVLTTGMNDTFMKGVEKYVRYTPYCANILTGSTSEDPLCPINAENPFSSKFVYSMSTETADLSSPAQLFIAEKEDGSASLYVMTVQISTGKMMNIYRYTIGDVSRPIETLSTPNYQLDISGIGIFHTTNNLIHFFIPSSEDKLIISDKDAANNRIQIYDIDFTTSNMGATLPTPSIFTVVSTLTFQPKQITDTFLLGVDSADGKVKKYTSLVPYTFSSTSLTESSADIRNIVVQDTLHITGLPSSLELKEDKLYMGGCSLSPLNNLPVNDLYQDIEGSILSESYPYRNTHIFDYTSTNVTAQLNSAEDISILTLLPVRRDQITTYSCLKNGDKTNVDVSDVSIFVIMNEGKDLIEIDKSSQAGFKSLIHKKIELPYNLSTSYFKYPVTIASNNTQLQGASSVSGVHFATPYICVIGQTYDESTQFYYGSSLLVYTCLLSRPFDLTSKRKILGWTVFYSSANTPVPSTTNKIEVDASYTNNYKIHMAKNGMSFILTIYPSNFVTRIQTYELTSPFDLKTATYIGTSDVNGPTGIHTLTTSDDLTKFAIPVFDDDLSRVILKLYSVNGDVLGFIDPNTFDPSFILSLSSGSYLFNYDKTILYIVEDSTPFRLMKVTLRSFSDWDSPTFEIVGNAASQASLRAGIISDSVMLSNCMGRWEPDGGSESNPPCVIFTNEIALDNTIGFTVELDSVNI